MVRCLYSWMNRGAEGERLWGVKEKEKYSEFKRRQANIICLKIIEKSSSTRFQTLGYAFGHGWSYDIWIL